MAVSEADVRNIALLARVGVDEARIPSLVAQLNGILSHMEVLQRVDIGDGALDASGRDGMTLRPDTSVSVPLARDRADFAPAFRDGFFLVPRLATHGDSAASGSASVADAGEDE
jgi:aspartyl-tRNA(Asn)/glutamyl-tRNA(Gln) amidotransferase subunit C